MAFTIQGAQDSSPSEKIKISGAEDAKPETALGGGISSAFATKSGNSVYDPPGPLADTGKNIYTSLRERGIGIDQLLNQMGAGKYVPFYSDGKIKLGLPSNEDLAKEEKYLESQEKGGAGGWLERQAVDPINYVGGPAKLGIGLKGALQSGISSLTAPSTKKDQTLGNRAVGTAEAIPLGFGTGKVFGYAGGKLAEKLGVNTKVEKITPTTHPEGVLGWIKNFVTDKKNSTISKDTESLGNAAKKVGLDITGKEPKQIYQELKNWYNKNVSDVALEHSKGIVAGNTHPIGVNFAVSETYNHSREGVTQLYNKAEKIGSAKGQEVEVTGLADDLAKTISDLRKKAPLRGLDPKYDSALDKLEELHEEINAVKEPSLIEKQLHSSIGKEAEAKAQKVSPNWLARLKQSLNEFHVPSPSMTKKDLPYARLGSKVREAIQKTSPEFQTALSKADMAHTEVERIFRNDTLKKFWTPEDHDAFKLVTGRGGNLNVDTMARANKLLDNIKTSADLDALREALPKEYYDSLRSAKFYQMMNKAGLDVNAIDKDYNLIAKSLRHDPAALHTVDAIKTVVEQLNARNIKNIAPGALEKSDGMLDRAMRFVVTHAIGGAKVKAINAVIGSTARKQTSPEAQRRLTGYAKDLAKSKPSNAYVAGPIPRALSVPLETSLGKDTQ